VNDSTAAATGANGGSGALRNGTARRPCRRRYQRQQRPMAIPAPAPAAAPAALRPGRVV